jgi:hypothetical protein
MRSLRCARRTSLVQMTWATRAHPLSSNFASAKWLEKPQTQRCRQRTPFKPGKRKARRRSSLRTYPWGWWGKSTSPWSASRQFSASIRISCLLSGTAFRRRRKRLAGALVEIGIITHTPMTAPARPTVYGATHSTYVRTVRNGAMLRSIGTIYLLLPALRSRGLRKSIGTHRGTRARICAALRAQIWSALQDLQSWNVPLVAQTGLQFDLRSAQGKSIASLMAALAEFERDLLRERVRSGIAAAQKRGVIFRRRAGQRLKADRSDRMSALQCHAAFISAPRSATGPRRFNSEDVRRYGTNCTSLAVNLP